MNRKLPNPEEINLVIYHADCFDGAGAAWAAHKALGDQAEYIPKQHGEDPFRGVDYTNKKVAFVDFAYDKNTHDKISTIVDSWVILDHHEKTLHEFGEDSNLIFDLNKSGSVLTWEWFLPKEKTPDVLLYIQDRDLWKWDLTNSPAVTSILDLEDPTLDWIENIHKRLSNSLSEAYLLREGDLLVKAQERKTQRKANKMVKALLLCPDGTKVPCLISNTTSASATCNAALSRDPNRIAVGWFYDYEHEFFRVSLRSDDSRPNVNKIASLFGGGGHRNAAGFAYHEDIRSLVVLEE